MITEDSPEMSPEVPPEVALMQLASGDVIAQLIGAVARLGIADELADGPKTSDQLA